MNSECVEVGFLDGLVLVRDSKSQYMKFHVYTFEEWAAFIAGVKAGEFDIPGAA